MMVRSIACINRALVAPTFIPFGFLLFHMVLLTQSSRLKSYDSNA